MGTIFLTSCGLKEKEESLKFFKFVKPLLSGKRGLVVTNATTTGHNVRAIQPTLERFALSGSTASQIELSDDNLDEIDKVDVLYVVGGDLVPLLNLTRLTNFKAKVSALLERGGIYIGESAGSIILGDDAKWYFELKKDLNEKYRVSLPSFKGLGLVSEKIYPHFNKASEEQKEKITAFERENKTHITCLCDGEWIQKDKK